MVKTRVLVTVLVVLALYACGQPQRQVMQPAPETEIALLYQSLVRGEIEECG